VTDTWNPAQYDKFRRERERSPELFAAFVAAYRDRLLARLDRTRPFFFPFKRILCWGQKGVREQPGAADAASAGP
jgi:hypothetical protein